MHGCQIVAVVVTLGPGSEIDYPKTRPRSELVLWSVYGLTWRVGQVSSYSFGVYSVHTEQLQVYSEVTQTADCDAKHSKL